MTGFDRMAALQPKQQQQQKKGVNFNRSVLSVPLELLGLLLTKAIPGVQTIQSNLI